MSKENKTLTWEFIEYEEHQRGRLWWLVLMTVSAALLIFALLTANYLFALIIIMVVAIILFRHYHEPEMLSCELHTGGVRVGSQEYDWSEIKNFWLVYEPPTVKSLFIVFKSALKQPMTVPLSDQNPLEVREFLGKYLEEDLEKETEPTSEALSRLLRL